MRNVWCGRVVLSCIYRRIVGSFIEQLCVPIVHHASTWGCTRTFGYKQTNSFRFWPNSQGDVFNSNHFVGKLFKTFSPKLVLIRSIKVQAYCFSISMDCAWKFVPLDVVLLLVMLVQLSELLCTINIPEIDHTTFEDDTAVLTVVDTQKRLFKLFKSRLKTVQDVQKSIDDIICWSKRWRTSVEPVQNYQLPKKLKQTPKTKLFAEMSQKSERRTCLMTLVWK